MELFIVILIVGGAVAWLVWHYVQSLKKKQGSACGGSCSNCPMANGCDAFSSISFKPPPPCDKQSDNT